MRVAVVGGSIGGLSVASVLTRLGHDVHIFERSAKLASESGGGIVVQPALLDLFRFLDLPAPASERVKGRQLVERKWERISSPQDMTSWSALWMPLRSLIPDDRFHERKVVNVKWVGGCGVLELEEAHTSSKDEFRADFIIGADGGNSIVREKLDPRFSLNRPLYAGYVAWRGVVPEKDLSAELWTKMDGWFTFFHGARTHILLYVIPSVKEGKKGGYKVDRRLNWVWYWNMPEKRLPSLLALRDSESCDHQCRVKHASISSAVSQSARFILSGQLDTSVVQELNQLSSEILPRELQEVVKRTERPFLQPIYDFVSYDPVLADGSAVLVGDAQAMVRPHTAYGTAKAAEDALWLGEVIGEVNREGLSVWERRVKKRNGHFAEYGRTLGRGQTG